MKGTAQLGLVVLALAVGVTVGWEGRALTRPRPGRSPSVTEKKGENRCSSVAPIPSKTGRSPSLPCGGDAELDSLRRRAEDLKKQIDAMAKPESDDSGGGEKTLAETRWGEWLKGHPKDTTIELTKYQCEGFEKYEAFLDGFDLSRLSTEDKALVERHFGLMKKRYDTLKEFRLDDGNRIMGDIMALNFKAGEFYAAATAISKSVTAALVGASVERRAREKGYSDTDASIIADAFRALWEVGNLE